MQNINKYISEFWVEIEGFTKKAAKKLHFLNLMQKNLSPKLLVVGA